jgi:hypothetical protein
VDERHAGPGVRVFLQQATALAQLAEAQLAFERQELPAGFIGTDYWRDATAGTGAPDRRGLTGSARLLQDVTRLDQYTEKAALPAGRTSRANWDCNLNQETVQGRGFLATK